MEVNEFDFAVEIFNQRGAAFHPVAAVQILHAVNHLHLGAMNVAADDAISFLIARHRSERAFIFGDEFDRRLGFEFQKCRQRPVTKTQRAAQPVEIQIEIENPVVKMRAEFLEQMIEVRQAVRLVAVDDEIFFPVGGGVDHLVRHDHAAKTHPGKLINELVMVAGDVNDLRLLAAFAQQFLDEQIVVVAPKPAELQFPAVNEIADYVEILAVHRAQKFQQLGDARMFGAEMDVGDPNGAADDRLAQIQIEIGLIVVHNLMTTGLCGIVNNFGNKLLALSPNLNLRVTSLK